MNLAQAILLQIMASILPKNHFTRLTLYAPISLSEVNIRNSGIRNAGNPKQHVMKKYAIYAPMEPHVFENAILSFLRSPAIGCCMMLWSFCPVEKNEINEMTIMIDMNRSRMPTVKFVFSLFTNDGIPIASRNEVFFFSVSFFFAIYVEELKLRVNSLLF